MSSFIATWKGIVANPFVGYGRVTKDTKIALPLICLLVLVAASTSLMLPIMGSKAYLGAAGRVQVEQLRKRGIEMSDAQLQATQRSLASPVTRAITVATTYLGALIAYVGVLLVVALLMKLLSLAVKASVPYTLLVKILVFAGVISVVQGLVKVGITLAGDWEGALRRVQSAEELTAAIQSSLSLALLFPRASLGKIGFYLLDSATDIFNWIYYVFVYAGLKAAAGLNRKQALAVILPSAAVFLAGGAGLALLL